MGWYEDFTDWFYDDDNWFTDVFVGKTNKIVSRQVKHQVESLPSKLDTPRDFDSLYDDPIAGTIGRPLLDWFKDKKIKEDAQRYYEDLERNTGQSTDNSPYQWKDYYEKGLGRYSGYGSSAEFFEASQSVINSFSRRLYKW